MPLVMPLYMDIHIVPGVKASEVAAAHQQDLLHQQAHSCTCMTYWIDEDRGNIFCLIEAPDKNAVVTMHNEAHGLIPHKIIEVNKDVVSSFLGRIYDPENATNNEQGLKVFEDSGFRVLLVTHTEDPVLLAHRLGNEKAIALLNSYNENIRHNISEYHGREAEHQGVGFVASFSSAKQAVNCALAIQSAIMSLGEKVPGFKMGISAGEPVAAKDTLFGDTIQKAIHLCSIASDNQVAISSSVQQLVTKEHFPKRGDLICTLNPQDERILEQLFNSLEEKWNDPDFDVAEYCQNVTMSKSQLYRKTVSITGQSPNTLLKDYRLEKAKEMMKQQRYSISQITFDAGFGSPSYFTKCFKKKYGLLPMAYLELLH